MTTDYTKPPLAPKPRLICHASLNSPLMSRAFSAARGPKPPIAPKPKALHDFNGRDPVDLSTQEECINGSLLPSDEELDQENEPEDSPNKTIQAKSPVELQFGIYSLSSGQRQLQIGSWEQKEEEVSALQEEDWRLSDSGLTEEAHSLEAMGVSDAGFTADSAGARETMNTGMTEDTDAEACDAGEALADADGLSVGDLSVISTEEDEAGCCSYAQAPGREDSETREEEEGKIQNEEEEYTADVSAESLTEEPVVVPCENKNTGQQSVLGGEEAEERSPDFTDCGITCNATLMCVSHESKEKARGLKTYSVNDEQHTHISSIIHGQKKMLLDADDGHLCLEVAPPLEPYYISSEDIIETLSSPADDLPENEQGYSLTNRNPASLCEYEAISEEESVDNAQIECMSSEDYVDIGNDMEEDSSDKNAKRPCQKRSVHSEGGQSDTAEAFLVHSSSQSRLRLVSVSVPREAGTFLTYSRSESRLLSPNDSDVFRHDEDLEGHIVPFLDDTTDTEHDLSDEHVYEEAGHDSEGENILPFDRRAMVMRSRSLSGKVPYYVTPRERGSQVNFQKFCLGGFGQMGPAMSSSPLLNMPRSKSYSRPLGLSTYTRSFSMEGRDTPLGVYRGRERGDDYVISSSGSLSQRSPLPSSGLSTPTSVVDIPPPFELAYITKRPITKSSPSLLIETDSHEKNKKKNKSSFKRFLMLKFRRKTGSKPVVDVNPSSCRPPPEPGLHAPSRLVASDRRSTRDSPQLDGRCAGKPLAASESPSVFLFYKDGKRKGGSVAFLNRGIGRVESFEDRSRVSFTPLPLTKPRSISFPNANISDYENIPAISSDYENVQVPHQRPVQQGAFIEFFDHPTRGLSSAHETDGYVDMSSFPGFESKTEEETESAYTEAYTVCSVAASAVGEAGKESAGEEEQGRTSEEEEGGLENTYDKQPDGRSRAFYIAKELVDTERLHVKALKLLQEDFREAVGAAVGDEGDPVLDEERLREILNELPDVYSLHRKILTELENRIRHWEENQRIADVILARKSEFLVFTTYIGHYDRSMNLLDESCRTSPAFATIVRQFEQQSPAGENISLKHQLLQVVVRVAQYRMLLTDYLNNLSPDSKEYEDTQAAVVTVSAIADQANDSLKHGENLLRLVNIEYSVRGQRGLLQPGRVFIKEGTLMKVSRKSRQPRHLFLTMGLRAGLPVRMFLNVDFLSQGFIDSTGKMNDVLLYTYPQQDGKYRLKNTLSLTGMKVSKPVIDNVQNGLKIDATDISITLSASSCNEREDWFYSLSRTVADHTRGPTVFNSCPAEARERLWLSLGEKAPTLVPVSHVMMCMSCNSDFGLTLRRHHCHACGRIVCRSCCRNRYPLKYMRDRMAKVCDHCYNQLKKKGGDVSALTAKNSPRLNRSSRPLSAVFQNIHPPTLWRHRKGTASLTQVTVSDEGSISGNLQRSKRSKKNWKRLWFLLKDKVLYTYRAREEQVASESLPLLGFTVRHPDRQPGAEETTEFQLYHKKTLYYTFKAEDNHTAQRWVNAMEEATVL